MAVREIIAAIISAVAAFDLALAVFPPRLTDTHCSAAGKREEGFCHFAGGEMEVQQEKKHSRPCSGKARI